MLVSEAITPTQMLEVEIGEQLPRVRLVGHARGGKALSLVRLHTCPLGTVELTFDANELSAADYAVQIWRALHREIAAHLRQDVLPPLLTLDERGIPAVGMPQCQHDRQRTLNDAPFASVIVSTRGRPASLSTCLASLLRLEYPNFEIIVVDNGPGASTNLDLPPVLSPHLPQVKIVVEPRPGLSRARNRGLAEAAGTLVAFLDDDAVADRFWLAELVTALSSGENVGVATGLVVPSQLETAAQLWFELYAGFGKGFSGRRFDLGENRPASPLFPYAAAMFGSGNNMACRVSLFRETGLFDPHLGAGSPARGGEDLALFYRAISRGYQLVYEPGAVIYHTHRRSYAALRDQLFAYGVGLTAYLTSVAIEDPVLAVRLAGKAPAILLYFLQTRSSSSQKQQAEYPRELTRVELRGMLTGPLAYLRGRWFRGGE